MFGKLRKSALITPIAALLLMVAAPVAAHAANADRDRAFGQSGWVANQQARGQDRRDAASAGQHVIHVGWRSDRRDDRDDRWSDRRYRRHHWHRDRWQSHWRRWDRRAGLRRHRHPHGHQWHPHR